MAPPKSLKASVFSTSGRLQIIFSTFTML